jgi:hypothetical protein
MKKSSDIQKLLHHTSPNVMERFPKTPRTQSEASWFGGCHKDKTNYLPS